MRTIKKFEDFKVQKMARKLCKHDFQLTLVEAFSVDFGLKNQIRDSIGPMKVNINKDFERAISSDIVQFVSIARASRTDCHSQHYRATDRNHITDNQFEPLPQQPIDLGRKIEPNYLPERPWDKGQ